MLDQASRNRPAGWWCLLGLIALFAPVPFRMVAAQPREAHRSDGEEYVLLRSNGTSTMNGSSADVERARKLLGAGEKEILWFRHGGKEYVVRDPSTLQAAFALFAPQAALGKRQGELGSRQAALGAEQAKLGAKQARLSAEQARVARDEGRETGEGREVNDRLARQQEELGKKQDDLGRQQAELGKRQDELGRKQDELGAQQDKLGQEADEKLRALVSDAVSRGLATAVGH